MDYLARREYPRQELWQKLVTKWGQAPEYLAQIEASLEDLQNRGLLSDERFAEAYLRYRAGKGMGPRKIALEMQQKGVEPAAMKAAFAAVEDQWPERARQILQKKYALATSAQARARQQRFLQQRGFTYDQIATALADMPDMNDSQ